MKVGGFHHISTTDGYTPPLLDIVNGMVSLCMRPNTGNEWKNLPHIILTHGNTWDSGVMDSVLSNKDDWAHTLHDFTTGIIDSPFDSRGNYLHQEPDEPATILPDITNDEQDMSIGNTNPQEANLCDLRANFYEASRINKIYTQYDQHKEPLTCYTMQIVQP